MTTSLWALTALLTQSETEELLTNAAKLELAFRYGSDTELLTAAAHVNLVSWSFLETEHQAIAERAIHEVRAQFIAPRVA